MKATQKLKTGGKAKGDWYAGGGSETAKEAEDEKEGGEEMHAGGKAKRARGGKAEEMHGEHERARGGRRMDRPGRKRGGGVGADKTPLSSASRTKDAEGHKTGSEGETGLDEDD